MTAQNVAGPPRCWSVWRCLVRRPPRVLPLPRQGAGTGLTGGAVSWSDLLLRIRALVSRARVERELEDEVDFHLAMARRKQARATVWTARAPIPGSPRSATRNSSAGARPGTPPVVVVSCRATAAASRTKSMGSPRAASAVSAVQVAATCGVVKSAGTRIDSAVRRRPGATRQPPRTASSAWCSSAGTGSSAGTRPVPMVVSASRCAAVAPGGPTPVAGGGSTRSARCCRCRSMVSSTGPSFSIAAATVA